MMGSLRPRNTIQSVLSKRLSPNILVKLFPRPEHCVCKGGIKSPFIHETDVTHPCIARRKSKWIWSGKPKFGQQDHPWKHLSLTHAGSACQKIMNPGFWATYPARGTAIAKIDSGNAETMGILHCPKYPYLLIVWFSLLKSISWKSQLCSDHP